jgi:hypothetical protein
MKIFGKSLSEYIQFQKYILIAILVVGGARLALSLAGVPDSAVKWLSITALMAIGTIYYAVRVHTTGFGSYLQLLPLLLIQDFLAQLIIAVGIAIAIFTGTDNIFSIPEYSPSPEAGRTWVHAGTHLIGGTILGAVLAWLVAMLIMFIVKKVSARKGAAEASA